MINATDILNWSIYKITSPSSRVYIGITQDFEKRMKFYKKLDCSHQRSLYHSFNKYGFYAHSVEIIDAFKSDFDYAYGKEIFWIRTYMSNYAKYPEQNGLNLVNGGMGGIGRVCSDETKEKLRQANLGKKASDETKAKLSVIRFEKPNIRSFTDKQKKEMSEMKQGFKHTDEAKKKISEAGKGNKYNVGKKQTHEWIEMMRKINTGKKYCLGRIQSVEERLKRSLASGKARPVIQLNLKNEIVCEYSSIKEAIKKSEIGQWSIRASLSGRIKNPKTFIFKYK